MLELAGLQVLDLTSSLCGAYCTLLLTQSGARVTKAEPLAGDSIRFFAPIVQGESAAHLALNQNKRSIAMDFGRPEAKDILLKMALASDVLVQDTAKGRCSVQELRYSDLCVARPRLIYCSISEWGERGPWANRPGAELVLQAASGYWTGLGTLQGKPCRIGADIAEINTGLVAYCGVLLAVLHRHQTGKGQYVTTDKLSTLLHLRSIMFAAQSFPDEWFGFHLDSYTAPPNHGYRTKDSRVYVNLRRASQQDVDLLLIRLGMEEWLADPRFQGGAREAVGLGRYASELRPVWENAFQELTTEEVVQMVRSAGGEAAPICNYDDLRGILKDVDPDSLLNVEHRTLGSYETLAAPWRITGLEGVSPLPPPRLGEHTDEALAEVGYTKDDIRRMRDGSVIR